MVVVVVLMSAVTDAVALVVVLLLPALDVAFGHIARRCVMATGSCQVSDAVSWKQHGHRSAMYLDVVQCTPVSRFGRHGTGIARPASSSR